MNEMFRNRNSAMMRNLVLNPIGIDIPSADDSLLAQHDRYFSTFLANSPTLLKAAHALRFQVYCLERKFENAEEHPDGLEKDTYDAHAIHGVLLHRPTRATIGTARMIFAKPGEKDSLPIMTLLRASSLDLSNYVNLTKSIEVSRFAISKEFRRRRSDQLDAPVLAHANAREINLAFLSLLQFVLRESIEHNVLFWTAVMEPKFLRLLARMGICYTPIGPLVVHHGIRQPCYCYVPDMLRNAGRVQRQCWEVLTDGGVLHEELAAKVGYLALA